MARNVEIKAVAQDFAGQQRLAAEVASEGPRLLVQHDVFYRVPHGRLKLRRFADGMGELIQYDRPDELGSKTCSYVVVRVERPSELHEALSRALGVLTEVKKRRTLYLAGRTRIHCSILPVEAFAFRRNCFSGHAWVSFGPWPSGNIEKARIRCMT